MKKIFFACLVTIVSATSVFAAPKSLVTEKVLKVFHEAFPEVKKPSWYTFDNYYEVYFTNPDNSSCRIDYSPDGILLSTTRYYTEQNLPPAIRAKVNEKYPGKKIFGITEVSNSENVTYNIVLEDNKNWYNIESDATGVIRLNKKLERTE
ncbi:hypothetical protein FW778_08065 [Ginsengibacter hankyongi]|uniref:Beta-lactamase-inhibitor-like PepSY-like domain-containing protein n=1 Tax=Ginsengibacter hankyongi TaxID=2607284 RepID=A0A5J5IN38_9BACT|nr:hypothetical protein [Ginsengibacter hankyongi]KAA9041958.1 hypothetical protein FW778_08065 [Ginsengibacter hankyongi]